MRRFLIAALIATIALSPFFVSAQGGGVESIIERALRSYNYTRVLERAEIIASLGSRAPGYPGYEETLKLVVSEAQHLGLKYTIQNFTMLVPVESNSYVEVLDPVRLRLKAYSLWPHGGLSAGAGSTEGYLVYVGRGRLEDFDGKPVNGSIVVMDYDGSLDNWVNALRFGAKAVIFLGGGSPEREALSKFDPLVPIPFMRLYLEPREAAQLRELLTKGPIKAKVSTDMQLRDVKGYNVLVEIPGTEKPEEIIMFVAHFDAWCVAPGLANSTEEAISPAALLELMRYFTEHKPTRTAWFLFTSGHWNGLTGPREFVKWFILQRPDLLRGERIVWYVMGLDISADFPVSSLIYVGHFYQTSGRAFISTKFYWLQGVVSRYEQLIKAFLNETGLPRSEGLRSTIQRLLDVARYLDLRGEPDWMWSSTMSKPYVLDTEPFVVAGMAAFTLRTTYSYRPLEGEPASDLNYVMERFEDRVVPQLAATVAIAAGLLNEPSINVMKSLILPTRLHPLLYWGFLDLQVQVLMYNITKGWYDTVPYSIVRVGRWSTYPFTWMFVKADSNGTALIYGVTPQSLNSWYVEAWKPVNSSWMFMPAWGMRSTGPTWVTLIVPKGYTSVYVMPLQTRILTDLYNPRLMRRTLEDPRYASSNVWAAGGSWPTQFETETGITPLYTFVSSDDRNGIFLAGSSAIGNMTITLTVAGARWPIAVTSGGERIYWALDYAIGTYTITYQRYAVLRAREVRKLSADLMLEYASQSIDKALNASKNLIWSEAYRNALAAWSFAHRAYSDEVMPLFDECIRSAILMSPLIFAAAYFTERILVKGEGFKAIFNIILFELAFYLAFAFVHPAFWVVPSVLLASLALGMLVLMFVIILIFYRESRDILAEISAKILGYHEVMKERVSAMLMALSLSTENIRKRPLRSVLTLLPLVVFSMALVSFASVSPYTAVLPARPSVEPKAVPFEGITIKRGFAVLGDLLDEPAYEMVKAIVGDLGYVSARYLYYSPSIVNLGPYALLISRNSSVDVPVAIGLSPEGAESLLKNAVIEGSPRPFFSDDQLAIALPSTMAKLLGVTVGDEVELYGMKLTVTAVFSETSLSYFNDLNGYYIQPIDSIFYGQLHGFTVPIQGMIVPLPYQWSRLVILPSGILKKIGGKIYAIDIIFNKKIDNEAFEELVKRIAYAVDAPCFTYREGRPVAFSKVPTYAAIGWEMLAIPFFITTLSIVISLLGSVKERTREIFTYSSVGLSPGGAMLMFITEFSVYGLLGATFGYFAGWFFSKVMRSFGALPPTLVFNYASVSIALVALLVLASSLLAAAYPSYLASRIVTPSLERKWKVPRAPRGTFWEIPLPFRLASEKEVQAFLLFMQEYYAGAGFEKRLFRVTAEPKVDLQGKRIVFNIWLYPFDAGTEQEVNLYFTKEKSGGWRAGLNLRLLKGMTAVWTGASQYGFLDDLRKQMLLWGTLPSQERAKYIRKAYELLASSENVMSSEQASGEREPKS